ncbi:Pentatricopeptide (PPR) repeat-containing protein-like [Quillaja saponaria]|uniref:Pentatricopeptide (PPR) repeat-containing protein-like n=1 Tax=Quillaja saponaria TaxID=32244 RepID=A0AAD7KZU6_QUISA|nr:Pentatricopeptide (PPR) repeat-containing protein-like [Quillaja saponaria]
MPSPKSHRRGQTDQNNRKGKLGEKSSSYHGNLPGTMSGQLRRPKTVPDLLSYRNLAGTSPESLPRQPPKLLLNVTMLGSLGAVHVVMTPDSTVGDLVSASVRQYAKECRRPILQTTDPSCFDLHYSQFSLESLDREKKLMELGSRNFFLCPKKCEAEVGNGGEVTTPFASCCKQADNASKTGFAWLKFLNF